ncbi:MBL fold metallo-hydrolase [Chitinophaga nivalis]|uniref:MBL fold metallo-hydrolase n=1 Tax=Chitinophaga nivalis TaxID=2991709 RepID=A0ABT3IVN4_9BACT|nr:MBL fold metallo-hydrolase [Chitinophaga nivalis]MCW3462559.1 MBL fold metallo-hydrolase [Chitinophaga nivalis]MCW3487750.1 MBL fold metallo-hydrolase [Chitinophaga nivalis]
MSTDNSRRNWLKQSGLAAMGLPLLFGNPSILAEHTSTHKTGSMKHYLCTTCGIQYNASETAPAHCPVCEDERQYVNPAGQSWTTLEAVQQTHRNVIEMVAPNLYAIYTTPEFAIGQRAHLLITPGGNILWDCVANLDASTINIIQHLGGIKAIALSHPHYFSTIVEWSHAFGHIPVYVHQRDAKWLGRQDEVIRLWDGPELSLWDGIKLVLCGGHFDGANVLYTPAGKGSLLVGDVIQVSSDRKTVSFMYSYPNNIPLSSKEINILYAAVQPLAYDAMYGAFGKYIKTGAHEAVDFSVKRYLQHIR